MTRPYRSWTCDSLMPSPGSETSDPMIDILHTDDVVLAQIGAGLHLDQIERHLSRILEPVHAAQRNKYSFRGHSREPVPPDSRTGVIRPCAGIIMVSSPPTDRIFGLFQNPLPDRNSLRIVRTMIVMSMRNDHFSM